MDYRKFGPDYFIRIERGEEVLATLAALCEQEGVLLATVQALGACNRAELAIYDVENRVFHRRTLEGPMEISSLYGTVTEKDGKPYLHMHGSFCGTDQNAYGGHVAAVTISATCEMTMHVIEGHVGREMSEEIGLNLFKFDN